MRARKIVGEAAKKITEEICVPCQVWLSTYTERVCVCMCIEKASGIVLVLPYFLVSELRGMGPHFGGK